MVSSHCRELLAEDLGSTIGLISVLGDDSSLGNHNPRTGVLKLCVDVDVFTFAETAAIDLSI